MHKNGEANNISSWVCQMGVEGKRELLYLQPFVNQANMLIDEACDEIAIFSLGDGTEAGPICSTQR